MKKVFLLIFSFIYLFPVLLMAKEIVIKQKTNLLDNNKSIGFITVLTPIEVIKKKNKFSLIKVKGFRLESYPQMVVRDMKRGELYMEIINEKKALELFDIVKEFEDEYGEVWHQVEAKLMVKTSDLSKNKLALFKKAKITYEKTCSMCHHLPLSTAYTVNQWPQQIESMMDQVSLEKHTKWLITKYLQQNAADGK